MGAVTVTSSGVGALTEQWRARSHGRNVVLLLGGWLVLSAALTQSYVPIWLLIGGLSAALLLSHANWASLAFVFLLYANLPVILTQYHGVPQAVSTGVVLFLLVPFVRHTLMERRLVVLTPALPLLLVYLGAMLLSTASSRDIDTSLEALANFLSEGLLLYFLLTNALRSVDIVRQAVWTVLLAGAVVGALSIYQEVTESYDNNFGGLAVAEGGQFKVGESVTGKVTRNRLAGNVGEQNRFAQVLLVLLPLAVYRARAERSRRLRMLGWTTGLLCLGGTLVTFSRGAAVAVFVVIVVMFLLREARLRHVVVLAAVLATAIVTIAPEYVIRLTSLQGVEGLRSRDAAEPDAAILGRATSNIAAFNTFADYPITGVGPLVYFKQFSEEYANDVELRRFFVNRRAHNMYLEIAADMGIVGLTAFLAVIGVTMAQLLRLRRTLLHHRPDLAQLATSLLLSLVAYMASALFLQLSYQRYFWLLMALANGAIWALTRETAPAGQAPEAGFAVATHGR